MSGDEKGKNFRYHLFVGQIKIVHEQANRRHGHAVTILILLFLLLAIGIDDVSGQTNEVSWPA